MKHFDLCRKIRKTKIKNNFSDCCGWFYVRVTSVLRNKLWKRLKICLFSRFGWTKKSFSFKLFSFFVFDNSFYRIEQKVKSFFLFLFVSVLNATLIRISKWNFKLFQLNVRHTNRIHSWLNSFDFCFFISFSPFSHQKMFRSNFQLIFFHFGWISHFIVFF